MYSSFTAFVTALLGIAVGISAQQLDPIKNMCTRFDHQCEPFLSIWFQECDDPNSAKQYSRITQFILMGAYKLSGTRTAKAISRGTLLLDIVSSSFLPTSYSLNEAYR